MKNILFIPLITVILISLLFCSNTFSQSKKQIKNLRIKTITETTTLWNKGKTNTYISSFTAYSKGNKPTNKSEFKMDGSIIKKETATYDSNGNKIEESFYELNDISKKSFKITTKYDFQGNKTEDVKCDGAGNFMRKQKFVYDNFDNKIQELIFDVDDKLLRKVIYIYDSDGLKIKRQEFNEKNELVSERKYQYTF
jgi:hypothetical protein